MEAKKIQVIKELAAVKVVTSRDVNRLIDSILTAFLLRRDCTSSYLAIGQMMTLKDLGLISNRCYKSIENAILELTEPDEEEPEQEKPTRKIYRSTIRNMKEQDEPEPEKELDEPAEKC